MTSKSPPQSTPSLATITVMRGETSRLSGLTETLSWVNERHIVETLPGAAPSEEYAGFSVHLHPLEEGTPFDGARAAAVPHIQANWVLVIDTDERIPRELAEYLERQLPRLEASDVQGAWIPRLNHVLGYALSHSSSWPDYQLRLFRTDAAAFSDKIHDYAPALARSTRFPADRRIAIRHYAFESTEAFVAKTNLYTSVEASQSSQSGAEATPARALWAATREFLARYLKMSGYRDGAYGLHIAVMMAIYRYLSHAKLWERGLPGNE